MVATWSPAPMTTRCAFGTWRRGKPKRRSGPYQLGQCRGSHTRWSPRGLRLRRQHAARLGPGDGGNQNDAPGPYRQVTAVAVTPDGRHVVSGSEDSTLRVWDLATGETKTTLQGHTSSGQCRGSHPRWSPRGLRLRRQHAARLGSEEMEKRSLTFTGDGRSDSVYCGAGQPDNRCRRWFRTIAFPADRRSRQNKAINLRGQNPASEQFGLTRRKITQKPKTASSLRARKLLNRRCASV